MVGVSFRTLTTRPHLELWEGLPWKNKELHTLSVHRSRGCTHQVCTAGGDAHFNAHSFRGTPSKCAQQEGIHTPMHSESGVHTPSVHRSKGYTLQVCTAGDAHFKCAQKQEMHTPSVHRSWGCVLQVCSAGGDTHSKCAQQEGRHRASKGLFAHIEPSCPSLQAGHEPQGNGRTKRHCPQGRNCCLVYGGAAGGGPGGGTSQPHSWCKGGD